MRQSIAPLITQPLGYLKSTHLLWWTLETMYANKININCTVELYEFLFEYNQGNQTFHEHFTMF